MSKDKKQRVVVITGAGSGIGRATARRFGVRALLLESAVRLSGLPNRPPG